MAEPDWKDLAARLTEALDEMMDRYAELLYNEFSHRPNDTRWAANDAVLKEARAALNDGCPRSNETGGSVGS